MKDLGVSAVQVVGSVHCGVECGVYRRGGATPRYTQDTRKIHATQQPSFHYTTAQAPSSPVPHARPCRHTTPRLYTANKLRASSADTHLSVRPAARLGALKPSSSVVKHRCPGTTSPPLLHRVAPAPQRFKARLARVRWRAVTAASTATASRRAQQRLP